MFLIGKTVNLYLKHDLPSPTCPVFASISLEIMCFRFLVVVCVVFCYIYHYLLGRLLESVHGGNNRRHEGITPLDQQDQLFTKAIDFPVKESHAWTEKVIFFDLRFIYFCLKQAHV